MTQGRQPPCARSAKLRETYRQALQLQAAAQKALGPGQPFVMWLLLETLAELTLDHPEGVHQTAIATRAGLSRKVVSHWMRWMDDLGFVDRGEHADGRCLSVILSAMGRGTLADCNERLEAAGLSR